MPVFLIEMDEAVWDDHDIRQKLRVSGLDCMSILLVRLRNPRNLRGSMRGAYLVLSEKIAAHEAYSDDFVMDLIEMDAKTIVWPEAFRADTQNQLLIDCEAYGLEPLRPLCGADLSVWEPTVGQVVESLFVPRDERWFTPGDGYIRLHIGVGGVLRTGSAQGRRLGLLSDIDPMNALLECAADCLCPVTETCFDAAVPSAADYLYFSDAKTAAAEIVETKIRIFDTLKDLNPIKAEETVAFGYMNILWQNGYLPLSIAKDISGRIKEGGK